MAAFLNYEKWKMEHEALLLKEAVKKAQETNSTVDVNKEINGA